MPGTRLSPPPPVQQHQETAASSSSSSSQEVQQQQQQQPSSSYGESSEAYFGDCSRDSSIERAVTPPTSTAKGRLYERGSEPAGQPASPGQLDDVLNSAFKSFCQLQEVASAVSAGPARQWPDDWLKKGPATTTDANIWAPLDTDWALLGSESQGWPALVAGSPADAAVQLSLALLNHHPERSGFSPVLAKSLQKALPRSSKLLEWLTNLAGRAGTVASSSDARDEEEVESILKEPDGPADDDDNLLTSPKTHFCPIQQEGDAEVQVYSISSNENFSSFPHYSFPLSLISLCIHILFIFHSNVVLKSLDLRKCSHFRFL